MDFKVVPGNIKRERILTHPFLGAPVSFFKRSDFHALQTLRKGASSHFTYEYYSFNDRCIEYWMLPRYLKLSRDDTELKKMVEYAVYIGYRKLAIDEKEAWVLTKKHCQPWLPIDDQWQDKNAMHILDCYLKSIKLPAIHFELTGFFLSVFCFLYVCVF